MIAEGPLDANAPEFITRGAALKPRLDDLMTTQLLRKMVNDWPQVFAEDDDEQYMNGGDAVQELCDYVREAKALLDNYYGNG